MTYHHFLRKNIDLTSLGIDRKAEPVNYFCTPRGASHIGSLGVDGIHFCFVRGYGETVFAVSPENLPGEYVHPIARCFEELLCLLLSVADVAALEQAWAWEKETFDRFLTENPPTDAQLKTIHEIQTVFALSPMEEPYAYIKALQSDFDMSKIRYSREYHDMMDAQHESHEDAFRVFYNGGFAATAGDRSRPGKELRIDAVITWGEERWHIPAAFICTKGLVIDFCIEVPSERDISVDSKVICNGTVMQHRSGFYLNYIPDTLTMGAGNDRNAVHVLSHYGLNEDRIWTFLRVSYPWTTKRKSRDISSLAVRLEREPEILNGMELKDPKEGDTFLLQHPITQSEHTLQIGSVEVQRIINGGVHTGYECPEHCVSMNYTLTPSLPKKEFSVGDRNRGDQPRKISNSRMKAAQNEEFISCAAVAIGVPDGPMAVMHGDRVDTDVRTAVSSLYFNPPEHMTWKTVFRVKTMEDQEMKLL